MISAEQLRAGRALVRITQEDLAEGAGTSVPTIKRWESGAGPISGNAITVEAVQRFLERAGVEFIPNGVRLRG